MADRAELQLAAALDHLVEHLVERELILAGPLGNQTPDVAAMMRNRLAQNRMMRDLCERLQIPFLDTTAALQARLESGENVYFPDESHLNETGEAVVAETLAAFLSDHFFVASGRSSRLPHSSHAP